MGSEVLFDKTEFFTKSYGAKQSVKKTFEEFPEFIEFGKPTLYEKPSRNDVQEEIASQKPKEDTLRFNHNNGYNSSYGNGYNNDQSYNSGQNHKSFCIRHSDPIKYNPNFPFSDTAYNSWKQWKNEDYVENFCHSCGKAAPTIKRRPFCVRCFYN